MARMRRGPDEPTIIKKYANRRLYDTGRSSYVTLDDLCEMIQDGMDFVVYDAKTNEDLTRSVLTQIIVEQEGRGQNMLPINFLRQLIGFYGDNVQTVVPNYLEKTVEFISKNQEALRANINKSLEGMGGMNPFQNMKNMSMGQMPQMPQMPTSLEDIRRQNMEIFERTMKMFTPFGMSGLHPTSKEERIKEIKSAIADLEKELKKIS